MVAERKSKHGLRNIPTRMLKLQTKKGEKMKKIFYFILIVLPIFLFSEIIEIKQDGTGDFNTIQAGIDSSSHDDIVLVYPGRYVENINFNGKNIILKSLEMQTGNLSYIDSTIIDGNENGSCIIVDNGEYNVTIRGFKLTNGSGSNTYAGRFNGGGIQISDCGMINIINCHIEENQANGGGGISCQESNLNIEGTRIINNHSWNAGGILFRDNCIVNFSPTNRCNIYNNYAGGGSDIMGFNLEMSINIVLDTLTVFNPDDYFVNYTHWNPSYAWMNPFTLDVQNEYLTTINADLYVSPNGDDNNDGLTFSTPLKTIAYATHLIESDSSNPKTIYLAEGEYSPEASNQIFPISLKKFTSLIGSGQENTFLDSKSVAILQHSKSEHNNFSNFTIRNLYDFESHGISVSTSTNIDINNVTIDGLFESKLTALHIYQCQEIQLNNLKILNNEAYDWGEAGITIQGNLSDYITMTNCQMLGNYGNYVLIALNFLVENHSLMQNCIISDNHTNCDQHAGILQKAGMENGMSLLSNCLFSSNETIGGEIHFHIGKGNLISNCTFVDNSPDTQLLWVVGDLYYYNSLFYNNSEYSFYMPDLTGIGLISELTVSHCNVPNGIDGVYNENGVNIIHWLDGNIDRDPLFSDPLNGDYTLQLNSPCIDGGTEDLPFNLELPETDLAGNPRISGETVDIGCYEHQFSEYGDIDENGMILTYDAALVLQFTIGIDPIPNIDPIPWEESRMISADVDGNGEVEAYDASLILQYAVGLITQFPVEESLRSEIPFASVDIKVENNELIFFADQDLFSLEVIEPYGILQFQEAETRLLSAQFGNRIAICSATAQKGEFLKIPYKITPKISSYTDEEVVINLRINSIEEDYRILLTEILKNAKEVDKFPDYYLSVFPNPVSFGSEFRNGNVKISYTISGVGNITLDIYNIKGQKIKNLITAYSCQGKFEANWNGLNSNGKQVASGQYFLKLQQNDIVKTKKIMVVK